VNFVPDNEETRRKLDALPGVYVGVVADTGDPDQRGRVRLRIPSILGDVVHPAWALPMMGLGDKTGSLIVPPAGTQVWVMFLEGDRHQPVWMPGPYARDHAPEDAASSYPDTRIIYADNEGAKILKDSDGGLLTRTDNKPIKVHSDGGDIEVDAKPGGNVVINRGADGQKAARKDDPVRCGSFDITFSPGSGGATLQMQYTDPDGNTHMVVNNVGHGTVDVSGKINGGSDSVKIGD
jgi:hypothetical protein